MRESRRQECLAAVKMMAWIPKKIQTLVKNENAAHTVCETVLKITLTEKQKRPLYFKFTGGVTASLALKF